MQKHWITLIALGSLSLSACLAAAQVSTPLAAHKTAAPRVRIVALTDLHGALEADELVTPDKKIVHSGGAAILAGYVNRLRETATTPTIVLDAGDLFQGTLVSNTEEGAPVIDFYNALQVDAAVIGNHDFDYGPSGPDAIPHSPDQDPRGALKDRMKQAKFPFLAANIRGSDGASPAWAMPSLLIEKGDVSVGVIGIAAINTPETTVLKNIYDLTFIDATRPIVDEAKKLRDAGADYIVVVTHTGGDCKVNTEATQNDVSSCDDKQMLPQMVHALPKGVVDLVVGGHTHKSVVKFIDGIPVLQSGSNSKVITWADLGGEAGPKIAGPVYTCGETITGRSGATCDPNAVKEAKDAPVPAQFLGSALVPDAAVAKLLQPELDRVAGIKNARIGVKTTEVFKKDYYEENPVGNLMADAYAKHFAALGANYPLVVLVNNGGLRYILPAGDLTYGDVFTVLPFDNRLATMLLTGTQLRAAIEAGITRKSGGNSWSGLTFEADKCKVLSVQVQGKDIDPASNYLVIAPDFIATGDYARNLGVDPSKVQVFDDQPVMRDVMVDALKDLPPPLAPSAYYDPKSLRQKIKTICQ